MKKLSPWLVTTLLLLVLAIGALVALGVGKAAPLRLVAQYPLDVLAEEARTMNDCAECHDTAVFHTCATCHDDHGAIEMENVPFYGVVAFEGDVPEPGYVLINDVLPYRDRPHTHVPLLTFLADQGVEDFESVTLASDDGGFVTLARDHLTEEALLMPYEDGIRFAAENLHISAWIKGVRRFVVVGAETPLTVDGAATSMGRLLLGPASAVTVEQTDVMLKSEGDGQIRRASVASRVTGARVIDIVAHPGFAQLTVQDAAGATHTLDAAEAQGALLAQFQGRATLVLPARGRGRWIQDVVSIVSQE